MQKNKFQKEERQLWLDLVRVGAILLMVVLHVAARYVSLWSEQSVAGWWVANVFDSVSRVCVPWLILASGALLLGGKELTWQDFYGKRLVRLVWPWLAWSVVFGFLNLVQNNEVSSLKRLLVGTIWTGFWLLPVFLGLYGLVPLWRAGARHWGRWWTGGWLLISGGILLCGLHLPLFFEYSFYFVAGLVLSRIEVKERWRNLSALAWVAGLAAVAAGTYGLSVANNGLVTTYYEFNSWPVVLMSLGGFSLLRQLGGGWEKVFSVGVKNGLTNLSQLSFQLYFIHLLFFRLPFSWVTLPGIIFIPFYSGVIFGLSALGAWWLVGGAEERT